MTRDENQVRPTDVAVIAMTGRFPGARGVEELWELLRNGVDAITDLSTEELRHLGLPDSMLEDPRFVKTSAILEDEDVETFDAEFFKYSPREAALIDPQQRLFLQCAWEAMERAGYATNRIEYPVGVWAGQGPSTYLLQLLGPNQPVRSSQDALFIGNDKDFLATRVSYELGLMGPSMNVQSACSTSLVATHLACQSLLSYECDMALAGGINITVPQRRGYLFEPDGPRSEDGRCRAFDADAQGTMLGNGVGVVVLKRLSDALADGDRIHAVIRGSAVGNDGDRRIGYRAPGVDGQAQVISAAQANAEVHPASLGYVETHGTATPLGDPIEVKALTRAFHAQTDRKRYCAIGSVKTNLSHLGSAAGVTGLIKAA
ncbi:MAG: beta-ketoacyl synthase N-terminal-like domain-containing protein, partial [bacterium]